MNSFMLFNYSRLVRASFLVVAKQVLLFYTCLDIREEVRL